MLDTRGRVPSQTQNEINERIRAEMARSVRYFEGRMDEIPARLRALDEDWARNRSECLSLGPLWNPYGGSPRQKPLAHAADGGNRIPPAARNPGLVSSDSGPAALGFPHLL
jgi:hypothetical protein